MAEKIVIGNLPQNNNFYLIWKYGAAVKLENSSKVPNIQVVLKKVNIYDRTFCNDCHDLIVYLPMHELDEVRIGSVWKYQEKVLDKWGNYKKLVYESGKEFFFNFEKNPPKSILFNEFFNSLNNSLSNVYPIHIQDLEKKRLLFLNKTKYVKLIDNNNLSILIPAMELFVSAYAPESKDIKRRLLNYHLDEAINEFIDDKNTKLLNNCYQVGLYKKMENSNMKFLAYAKFNSISRARIKSLYLSLEFDEGDTEGGYAVRYPNVLPYHPTNLIISSADGIWLNNKTFLIHRINIVKSPNDIHVKSKIEKKKYSLKEKRYTETEVEVGTEIESEHEDDNNNENSNTENGDQPAETQIVDSNKKPKTRTSVSRIKTQVEVTDDDKPEIVIVEEEVEIPNYIQDDFNYDEEKVVTRENNELEGKKTGIDENVNIKGKNKNTSNSHITDADLGLDGDESQKINYVLSYRDEATNILFNEIITILTTLKKENLIEDYKFIDSSLNRLNKVSQTTFFHALLENGYTKNELTNPWYMVRQRKEEGGLEELGFREYFLIEIELLKNGYCYLLEVGKKPKEHFLGVLFRNNNSYKLSNTSIIELLKKVVANNGNYKKKDPLITEKKKLRNVDLGVKYETYSHKFDENLKKYKNLKVNIKKKLESLNHNFI